MMYLTYYLQMTKKHLIIGSNCPTHMPFFQVPPALCDENREPINKGTIYISESSPPCVAEAYLRQFQEDFTSFLRLRSEELVSGGRMVLILLGRRGPHHVDRGNSFFWELLSRSLSMLVAKVTSIPKASSSSFLF